MTHAIAWLAACAFAFAQAATPPRHVLALYVDLDSASASRAMVVLRTFTERHPGVVSLEVHLVPPRGIARDVDRAAVAAAAQGAGLQMAELMLANPSRRTHDDFIAMARQLRLDEERFTAALALEGAIPEVAADIAAGASLELAAGVAALIDGQPLGTAITLPELERRLQQF